MLRFDDWLRQARRKLESARWGLQGGFHEDVCFASQQSAELALKALLDSRGQVQLGHSLTQLMRVAQITDQELNRSARLLDRYYIATRYPDGFSSGAPMDYYDAQEAQEAIDHAESIVKHVEQQIAKPPPTAGP